MEISVPLIAKFWTWVEEYTHLVKNIEVVIRESNNPQIYCQANKEVIIKIHEKFWTPIIFSLLKHKAEISEQITFILHKTSEILSNWVNSEDTVQDVSSLAVNGKENVTDRDHDRDSDNDSDNTNHTPVSPVDLQALNTLENSLENTHLDLLSNAYQTFINTLTIEGLL